MIPRFVKHKRKPKEVTVSDIRRASKGAFWYKKSTGPDGAEVWLAGCGGESCYSDATLEGAVAKLIIHLADMAHWDGGWNSGHHKTPELY